MPIVFGFRNKKYANQPCLAGSNKILKLQKDEVCGLPMQVSVDQGSATCGPRAKSGPPTHFIRPAACYRSCVFIRPAISLHNHGN